MNKEKMLIWLPSPLGDTIMATAALEAFREHFANSQITFFASDVTREILTPCQFNDNWLKPESSNPFVIAEQLKKHNFDKVILLKNSFGCAMAAWFANIKHRIGYVRDFRGLFLTDKLHPVKLSNYKCTKNGRYKPVSMVDYYLAIAQHVGCNIDNRQMSLSVSEKPLDIDLSLRPNKPTVILVPGGGFGPSKCWPKERFAETADWLIENYHANILISVAPNSTERKIASAICQLSKHNLINLDDKKLDLNQLKTIFSNADLVITNDTGPRHIATALGRNVICLLGPNDPILADTNSPNEVQIIGEAPCAPCLKPICKKPVHYCMESISVKNVCNIAKAFLDGENISQYQKPVQLFAGNSESFQIDKSHQQNFAKTGLKSIDDIFNFSSGKNLHKSGLASYKNRTEFEIDGRIFFMKRYSRPPISVQIKNWLCHKKIITCGQIDFEISQKLKKSGINTVKTVCYGWELNKSLEKRSFSITEKIADSESLEQKLPNYVTGSQSPENRAKKITFLNQLAKYIKRFHNAGFRHRDLYLCHIFYDSDNTFSLIDLARVFKPTLLAKKYLIKDLTQLYYSSKASNFTKADKLRFYLAYMNQQSLTSKDKRTIAKIKIKAAKMAKHDIKHGRVIPFEN